MRNRSGRQRGRLLGSMTEKNKKKRERVKAAATGHKAR